MDYDDDLVEQKKLKHLDARHDGLPIVFGAMPKSSMDDWDEFRQRNAGGLGRVVKSPIAELLIRGLAALSLLRLLSIGSRVVGM